MSDSLKAFAANLKALSRSNLLPCMVFSFSRAKCEELANALSEQTNSDYTSGYEKGTIKKFLSSKLQRLAEHDRGLPQIDMMRTLLAKGIGVHHAGLLPIVKELVEILFQDGLLKVVFATTTFAIGLNMPARSVMFT
jgi:antiviral helicase SKI2